MKTLRKEPVELVEIPDDQFIPHDLEPGKLYWSKEYKVACHNCLCGCGVRCCIPIKPGEWLITKTPEGKVTVTPSIQQRFDCKSHYIITAGVANFV